MTVCEKYVLVSSWGFVYDLCDFTSQIPNKHEYMRNDEEYNNIKGFRRFYY